MRQPASITIALLLAGAACTPDRLDPTGLPTAALLVGPGHGGKQVGTDRDGDGFLFKGVPADCDDRDPGVHPKASELCDGRDQDCDGLIDEDFAPGQTCTVGLGACLQKGRLVCSADGRAAACDAVPGTPEPELCGNDLDDDCDGSIDEDFTTLGLPCHDGIGQCAREGVLGCSDDGLTLVCDAVADARADEACNGLDDDCDGLVDDGDLCGPLSRCEAGTCAAGVCSPCLADAECGPDGLCAWLLDGDSPRCLVACPDDACPVGTRCVGAGRRRVCAPDADADGFRAAACGGSDCDDYDYDVHRKASELCNDRDDDCDGLVDDGFALGSRCVMGKGACARAGSRVCSEDGLTARCDAAPGDPLGEAADGEDNDCDGLVDEGFLRCTALTFDGVDDRVEVPWSDELDPDPAISVGAWVRPESFGQGEDMVVAALRGETSDSYWLSVWSDTGQAAAGVSQGGQHFVVTSPQPLKQAVWHQLVLTSDQQELALYVDGELAASVPTLGDRTPAEDGTLFLGSGGDSRFLHGALAEVFVATVALSADAVADVAVRGGADEVDAPLAGHWPLDDADGARARDVSGRGSHGSLAGATWSGAWPGCWAGE